MYTRDCVNGEKGDTGCHEGESEKYEKCVSAKPCPSWSIWSDYSACSVTCGGGKHSKTRVCRYEDSGQIVYDACPGKNVQTDNCNES